MLLAVLLLFLITEFPQGILGVMGVMLGQTFMLQCYFKLGKFILYFKYFTDDLCVCWAYLQMHSYYRVLRSNERTGVVSEGPRENLG